ncbi:unnamed protein product [Rotaria sp. Silwood2]|nr:unnamed protein product [Rotaria sp. Silwood2]CAF4564496.1 unnamed protein product [Rotaria sp. Silwood2]CAF4600675.1 unnamed protein product [Rotaria sp. Silwood2]
MIVHFKTTNINCFYVNQCLEKLREVARDKSGSGNILEANIEAARARCTLGEIFQALEDAFSRHVAESGLVSGAYRKTFDDGKNNNELKQVIDRVETPSEVARQAIDADVHIVGVSTLGAGHKSLEPELIKKLNELRTRDIIVTVGGVIPPQDYQQLYDQGVKLIFRPGTRIPEAVIQILGHIEKTFNSSNKPK